MNEKAYAVSPAGAILLAGSDRRRCDVRRGSQVSGETRPSK